MASKSAAAILIAIAGIAGAAELYVYRVARPKYETAHFDSPTAALDYPATWRPARWLVDAKHRDLMLAPVQVVNGPPYFDKAKGFTTRWDGDPQIALSISPTKKYKDRAPRDILDSWRQQPNEPGVFWRDAVFFKPVQVSGHEAWALRVPWERERLDIVDPTARPGFLAKIYGKFFGAKETQTWIMVRVGDEIWEISYRLPGDAIGRARYERVFNRIIDSLKIKDA